MVLSIEIKVISIQKRYYRWLIFTNTLLKSSKTIQQCHMFAVDPRNFYDIVVLYNNLLRKGWFIFYITDVVIFRLQLRWAYVTTRKGCHVGFFALTFL